MEKITKETRVSTSEMAVVLGLTARRVRQMVEDGILLSEGGKLLLADSVRRYQDFIIKDVQKISDDDQATERKRKKAEAQIKESKAKIAKLEVAELEGKMHRAEDVAALTEDLIFTIRGALMALPGRLAMDVATVTSKAEAAEIIRKEVYKVMRELADYRYDPKKYEERVRERRDWDVISDDGDDEE